MSPLKKVAPVVQERGPKANRKLSPNETPYQHYSTEGQFGEPYHSSDAEKSISASQGGILGDFYGWWKHRNSVEKVDRRRPAWLRPYYLDICTWTKQNSRNSYKYSDLELRLKGCSRTWRGPKDGSKRPVGCGDRVACPVCADYYHGTLAREATKYIDTIFEPFVQFGYGVKQKAEWPYVQAWGHLLTLTLPKQLSLEVDEILFNEPEKAKELLNKLRAGAWRVVNRTVEQICKEKGLPKPGKLGALMVLHYWQSGAPWEPHYHWHIYLMPFVERKDCELEDIFRWDKSLDDCMWSEDALVFMRAKWKKAAQRILGMKYEGDWDVHHKFVADGIDKKTGAVVPGRDRVGRVIAYQMRAPMRDLWRGVRKYDGTNEYFCKGKKGKRRDMFWQDFEKAYERAELIRQYVKRVSWFGYLSNVRNKKVNLMLGLEFEEKQEREPGPGDEFWTPVSSNKDGVLFKKWDDEMDFTPWENLESRPVGDIGMPPIGKKRIRCWYYAGVNERVTARAGPLILGAS